MFWTLAVWAYPLDLSLDAHRDAVDACAADAVEACVALSKASMRAYAGSLAAQARGEASVDRYRRRDAIYFAKLACGEGHIESCLSTRGYAAACRLGSAEGCARAVETAALADRLACGRGCKTPMGPIQSISFVDGMQWSSPSTLMHSHRRYWGRHGMQWSSPSTLMHSDGRYWGRRGAKFTDFVHLPDGRLLLREPGTGSHAQAVRPFRYTWFGEDVEVREIELDAVPSGRVARNSDGVELLVIDGEVVKLDPASGEIESVLSEAPELMSWTAGGGAIVTKEAVHWLDGDGHLDGVLQEAGVKSATAGRGLRAWLVDDTVFLNGEPLCSPRTSKSYAVAPDGTWAACLDDTHLRFVDPAGQDLFTLPLTARDIGTRSVEILPDTDGLRIGRLYLSLSGRERALPPSRFEEPMEFTPKVGTPLQSVTIVLSDGAPDIPVYLRPSGSVLDWRHAPAELGMRVVETDAAGQARFEGLAPGNWFLDIDGRSVLVKFGDTPMEVRRRRLGRVSAKIPNGGGVVVATTWLGGHRREVVGPDGSIDLQVPPYTKLRVCGPGGVAYWSDGGELHLKPREGAELEATLTFLFDDGVAAAGVFVEGYGITDTDGRLDVVCFNNERWIVAGGVRAHRSEEGSLVYRVAPQEVSPVRRRQACKRPHDPACAEPTHPVEVIDHYGHPVSGARVEYSGRSAPRERYVASTTGVLQVHDSPAGRLPVGWPEEDGKLVRRTPSERILARPVESWWLAPDLTIDTLGLKNRYGLKVGYRIVAVEGQPVATIDALRKAGQVNLPDPSVIVSFRKPDGRGTGGKFDLGRCDSRVRGQSDEDKHYIDTPSIDAVLCPRGDPDIRTDPWWASKRPVKAVRGRWTAITDNVDRIQQARVIAKEQLDGVTPRSPRKGGGGHGPRSRCGSPCLRLGPQAVPRSDRVRVRATAATPLEDAQSSREDHAGRDRDLRGDALRGHCRGRGRDERRVGVGRS